MYFGQNWRSGTFKFPAAYKFDSPHCGSADIANGGTIVIRLLREAIDLAEAEHIARVLGLAEFYLRALLNGDHFQSAAIFCDDFVPIIPTSGFEEKNATIRGLQARSLRMMGERARAKEILIEIADFPFSTSARQTVLINLALCHQSLDYFGEAKKVADEVVKLNRHSNMGLQAKALIVELDDSDPKRTEKLSRLENVARKKGAMVVANNIALLRALEAGDNPDQVREILMPVVNGPRDKPDFYNKTRAALQLATLSLNADEKLTEGELVYLIGAYHFLFNERMSFLFDQCHEALWRAFESVGDITNLLILFRYSSLYWQLRAGNSKESRYLQKLSKVLGKNISEKVSSLNREAAYYLVRASTQVSAGDTARQT